jgi:hypothetical protein
MDKTTTVGCDQISSEPVKKQPRFRKTLQKSNVRCMLSGSRVCTSLFVCLSDSCNATITNYGETYNRIIDVSEFAEIPAFAILKFALSSGRFGHQISDHLSLSFTIHEPLNHSLLISSPLLPYLSSYRVAQ